MATIRIGAQIRPNSTSMKSKEAWLEVEALGADTLFTWDHFYPLPGTGAPEDAHFEGYTQLAAIAALTSKVEFGNARQLQLIPKPESAG